MIFIIFWVFGVQTSTGMFLTQQKYLQNIIRHFHMHIAKPIAALSLSEAFFTIIDGEPAEIYSKSYSSFSYAHC